MGVNARPTKRKAGFPLVRRMRESIQEPLAVAAPQDPVTPAQTTPTGQGHSRRLGRLRDSRRCVTWGTKRDGGELAKIALEE